MAGKRRAYAVLVTLPNSGFKDTLCMKADGQWAISGTKKEAEADREYLLAVAGTDPCAYQIVKVELK